MIVDGGADNVSFSRGSAATDQAIVHISRGGYDPGTNGKHALMVGANIGDANTLGNNARKFGSIVVPHYTNSEQPLTIANIDSDNGSSVMTIGGYSTTNSVEKITFRTATDDADKTTGADRMVIDLNGHVGIGSAPGNTTLVVSGEENGNNICLFDNTHDGGAYGPLFKTSGQATDNNSLYFLTCADSGTVRMRIYSDGDLVNHDNSYGAISDERIKQNITDSGSQWDDIKAIKVRKYKLKDDVRKYGENAWEQIGVISQELVTAGMDKLVNECDPASNDIESDSSFGTLYTEQDKTDNVIPDGKDVGDIKEIKTKVKNVKYSLLYMKAIKCLQEAMTKIETLETENTDIKARIKTLEDA
jgi:hypothetical protein